ncbi:cell wall-binding repeat-containing protein [Palaeococcus ferrophilus]|uniref:cell wall-binding repeat-containing protein n=1 Tax=Palaeococcus ferrophilus TaxID=83868 RepID=UPI00064FC1B3|nr:hypothetical protein [Palaeococcus ferrophilus]
MMWKKVLASLFGVLLLAGIVPLISAEENNTVDLSMVILVSDNEADSALAEKIAESLNVSIVVTPWGVYDPNVTSEIASYAPDKVLIIGGPAAVPKLYEDDLVSLNISYARVWGKDRYGTNAQALEYLVKNYPELMKNVKIVIAHGRDLGAIKDIENRSNVFPIYVDNGHENQTDLLGIIKVSGVVIIKTPISGNITERIRERVRERAENVTEVEENITAEVAWEAIEIAQNKTALAESMVENATIPAAPKLLELAKKELDRALEAYNESNYGKAYGQAMAAKVHAEAVIRMSTEKFSEKFRNNLEVRAKVEIAKVERMVERFGEMGFNVTAANETLQQAKAAYDGGRYGEAYSLAKEAEDMLRGLIHEKKLEIREKMREKIKERIQRGRRHGQRP